MSDGRDSLIWGHGTKTLEVFLEPTCPFSIKALKKLPDLLERAGKDRLKIGIRLQSQPWHMFSGVIVRAVLAAAELKAGKDAVWAVLMAVAEHREAFEFEEHCSGPNMDATPHDILKRIEEWSGVSLAEVFENSSVTQAVKWQARYARQNGIHVSPTFMVDGLIDPAFSSGEEVDVWHERLLPKKR